MKGKAKNFQQKGNAIRWYQDPAFKETSFADDFRTAEMDGRPAFRFTLHSHTRDGHPFEYGVIYDEIFSLFEPILRRDTTHVAMYTSKGTSAKRKDPAKAGDWWSPFAFMRQEFLNGTDPHSDYSIWHWNGFDFLSGLENSEVHRNSHRYLGPTKFSADFFGSIKIDVTIPVVDFEAGAIDIERLKELVLLLPVATANMGYGICCFDSLIGETESVGYWQNLARRFPALDVCPMDKRNQWRLEHKGNFTNYWLDGITWITFVGNHFLEPLGGVDKLTKGLDSRITWEESKNGVLFQLGSHPITGEAGVDDDLLPLYFELGARLKPFKENCPSASHNWQRVFSPYPEENLNWQWARRFYDSDWIPRTKK